jgi:hypothetical protein
MSLSFFVAPSVFAVLDTKIDMEVFKNAINGKPLEVFVELTGECVVQKATFKCENPVNSMELMKPDNKIKSVSLATILSQQKSLYPKIKRIVDVLPGDFIQYSSNGFLCKTEINSIRKIARLCEVKMIHYLAPLQYHRFVSRGYVKSEKVYTEFKDKNGNVVDGSGVLTAVTDSGLDYTHQDYGS